MQEETHLAISQELAQIMSEAPPQYSDELIRELVYMKQEMQRRLQRDPKGTVRYIYATIDKAVATEEIPQQTSCKKGCSFCCHMNVDISYAEAEIIADYAKTHNIPLPKDYLREQLKYSRDEVSVSNVSKCVFLKDGVCGIYPVRPFKCRKYYVATPPSMCEIKKPFTKVGIKIVIGAELVVCAYASVTKEEGRRMPKQLLRYAK